MIHGAKNFIDEVYQLDAIHPPVPGKFADFIFIRFLNSEVVTRAHARKLYDAIIQRCKINGYIIVFGHTPVLLSIYDLERDHLRLLQTIACDETQKSIFQYYILHYTKENRDC
ncbi:MAG TPA: hypothetical protein VK133_00195 [Amoebophilaceae bacterium]|nr:hypothetical protein [Amoebophilaceae bacterium]